MAGNMRPAAATAAAIMATSWASALDSGTNALDPGTERNLEAPYVNAGRGAPAMKKLTPILPVASIEPSLPFWERLGFQQTVAMPEEGVMDFVIIEKDGVEIMYQALASFEPDRPALGDIPERGTLLYLEVEDLAAVEAALGEADVLIPRRRMFYGADEVVVREPGGHIVTFAEMDEG